MYSWQPYLSNFKYLVHVKNSILISIFSSSTLCSFKTETRWYLLCRTILNVFSYYYRDRRYMLGMYRDYVQWKKIKFSFQKKGLIASPIGRVKICTAIKLRFKKKKVFSLFGQNSKPSTGIHLMKIRLFFLIILKFFSAGTFSIIKQTMFKSYFW